jgi:hypothetical protein
MAVPILGSEDIRERSGAVSGHIDPLQKFSDAGTGVVEITAFAAVDLLNGGKTAQ